MNIPFGALIKSVMKSLNVISYIFSNVKIEVNNLKLIEEPKENYLNFSMDVINTKNTKLFIRDIEFLIKDENLNLKKKDFIFTRTIERNNSDFKVNIKKRFERVGYCNLDEKTTLTLKFLYVIIPRDLVIGDKRFFVKYKTHRGSEVETEIFIKK